MQPALMHCTGSNYGLATALMCHFFGNTYILLHLSTTTGTKFARFDISKDQLDVAYIDRCGYRQCQGQCPPMYDGLYARRFSQSLGPRSKTDKIDARMLAAMGTALPLDLSQPKAYRVIVRVISLISVLYNVSWKITNLVHQGAKCALLVKVKINSYDTDQACSV